MSEHNKQENQTSQSMTDTTRYDHIPTSSTEGNSPYERHYAQAKVSQAEGTYQSPYERYYAKAKAEQANGLYQSPYEPQTATAASTAASVGEDVASQRQPVYQPAQVSSTIDVTGKTKLKKSPLWKKVVSTVLIALIGGAAGAGITYALVGGNSGPIKITTVNSDTTSVKPTYTKDGNMTITSIAQKASPAVVGIYNLSNSAGLQFGLNGGDSDEQAQAYGSGVLISADGLLITNFHVIQNASKIEVATQDGKHYTANVLGSDSSLDLAVLKIDSKNLPYVEIANSDDVKVGDLAVAIGNPLADAFSQTVTDGIISGINRKFSNEGGDIGYIQTNASINSGNSGGALLNGQGQLIGINSRKIMSVGVEGMAFAIPSNVIQDFVKKVGSGEASKSTQKAWIGISGYNMTEDLAKQYGFEQKDGVLIARIYSNTPAAQQGLEAGDIITKIDNTTVKTFDDLRNYIAKKSPGDKVKLTVVRNNVSATVEITLTSSEAE